MTCTCRFSPSLSIFGPPVRRPFQTGHLGGTGSRAGARIEPKEVNVEVADARSAATDTLTPQLLRAGVAAAPLYILVGLVQVLTREGFDVRRHALSLLSNGDLGWIQIASFILSGLLVLAGAVGARRVLAGRGSTWGPLLLAVYGVGLIGSGIFVADPGLGFPPGTSAPEGGISRSGLLHFVFGAVAFYALIAACFVFARRFAGLGRRGWAVYSIATGVGFFITFAGIASGSTSPVAMLAFYFAVAWIWVWHSAVSVTLLRAATRTSPGAP